MLLTHPLCAAPVTQEEEFDRIEAVFVSMDKNGDGCVTRTRAYWMLLTRQEPSRVGFGRPEPSARLFLASGAPEIPTPAKVVVVSQGTSSRQR